MARGSPVCNWLSVVQELYRKVGSHLATCLFKEEKEKRLKVRSLTTSHLSDMQQSPVASGSSSAQSAGRRIFPSLRKVLVRSSLRGSSGPTRVFGRGANLTPVLSAMYPRLSPAFAAESPRSQRSSCGHAECGLASGSRRCPPGSNSSRAPSAPALHRCGHLEARRRPPL